MSQFILPTSKMEKHRRFEFLFEVNQLSYGKMCYCPTICPEKALIAIPHEIFKKKSTVYCVVLQ